MQVFFTFDVATVASKEALKVAPDQGSVQMVQVFRHTG